MRSIVICWTAFNSFSLYKDHRELSEQWIKKRYAIWKKYTLKSILGQTTKGFMYFVVCNKKAKAITDKVFLPVTSEHKNVVLVYRDEKTRELVSAINKKYGSVYAVRVDSDDMYSNETFGYILKNFPAGRRYAYFRIGYGYDTKTGRVWHYDSIGSSPFFVERFCGNYNVIMTPHHKIKRLGGVEFGSNNFMVTVNGTNSSTRLNKKYFKKEITGLQKIAAMRRFAI